MEFQGQGPDPEQGVAMLEFHGYPNEHFHRYSVKYTLRNGVLTLVVWTTLDVTTTGVDSNGQATTFVTLVPTALAVASTNDCGFTRLCCNRVITRSLGLQ